ncbi:MAG: WD40 repeat domain-containing protein [Myxococcota bacterium]|nr:WD40 repeat domain-containing protein [Myxococcota bacterium]
MTIRRPTLTGSGLPFTIFCAAWLALASGAGAATITLGNATSKGNFLRYLDTETLVQSDVTPILGITGDVTDIAYSPSGDLYAISFSTLYRVDEITGVATDIGLLLPRAVTMNALTFGPDGTLYAASGSSSTLYTVDVTTGAATPFGTLGGGLVSSGDLVFDDEGVLWATLALFTQTDRLARLSPGGAGTVVGDIGRSSIFGLTFADGVLYGIGGRLYEIDRADGSLISERGGFSNVQGLAFRPVSVPEPGALLLQLAGVAGLAGLGARGGRQAETGTG